jgi:hypothetical protein
VMQEQRRTYLRYYTRWISDAGTVLELKIGSHIEPEGSRFFTRSLTLDCEPTFTAGIRRDEALLNPRTLNGQKWLLRNQSFQDIPSTLVG